MPIPAGIPTVTCSIGTGFAMESGVALGANVTVNASVPGLVWAATGDPGISDPYTLTIGVGAAMTFPLIPTDLAGWKLNGAVVDVSGGQQAFTYTIVVQWTKTAGVGTLNVGSPFIYRNVVVPQATSGTLDLDLAISTSDAGGVPITLPPTFGGGGGSLLARTAVKTSATYTAAANDLVPVDTTSNPVTVTLPNAPADKAQVAVEHIVQGGTNVVTIACAGADVLNKAGGPTSMTLPLVSFGSQLQYDAATKVWTPIASPFALAQLDARYPLASSLGTAATKNVGTTSTTVAAGDAPAAAAAAATLAEAFGTTQGVPVSPWAPSPTIGSELWALANFQTGGGYNSTTLTPSLTANGTNQTSKTRVSIGNMGNGDTTYRIEFDFNITAASNASISLLLTDSSSALISGTTQQRMVTATCKLKTGHYVFDFRPPAAGGTYVELRLDTGSAVSSGVVGVSNVSLKQTGEVSRPMMVAQYASGQVFPVVYWQHKDATTRAWRAARLSFKDDNNLTPVAYNSIDSWSSDVFLTGLNVPADPAFTRVDQTIGASVDSVNGLELSGSASMRSNNNDQIMEVWNGSAFELRCNTHGGEYPRAGTSPSYKIDQGSGFVPWTLAEGLVPIRRFQISIPSEVRRSTDGTTPFANVDHTFTVFPDGVVRCDRTTTFLSTQLFRSYFEWMSSHSLTTPYLGRIGRGLTVQANVDTHPKVATPAAPTVTTSTSGGTLAAGTYSYRIAALSPYGETLASTAGTVTTTGSTSTATPAWSTVASATGYRVYGRTAGVEKLLATLGAAATSWTDDGSLPPIGDQQAFSTARLYTGVLATALVVDNAESTDASWAVWLNPLTRYCQGAIYDRESALARAGVAKIRTRIEGTPNTIQKNYANLYWTSGDTFSIPAGTVWTATHWSMSYIPENTDRFHTELAYRAANLSSLAALYPNT